MDPNLTTEEEKAIFANTDNEPHRSFSSHLIEFIQTLVVFAAIASAIYLFIAQPHKVSGSSMFPNFQSGDYIITDKISYRFNNPQRGDVVVFKNPRDLSQDFIKRIIGLPGDNIKIENNHIFVNGKELSEPFLKPGIVTDPGSFLEEGEEITVPQDRYIVIGDNRSNSSDSREWGFIEKSEIIGKVLLRYWPQDSIEFFPAAYKIEV